MHKLSEGHVYNAVTYFIYHAVQAIAVITNTIDCLRVKSFCLKCIDIIYSHLLQASWM